MYFNPDDDSQGSFWLSEFKSIDSLEKKLQYVIVLIYSLSGDKQDLFEADLKILEKIFSDINFMRQLRLRDSMIKDYANEYFGMDYGRDDPFRFNMPLERKINRIELELMSILGRIINVVKSNNFVIDDSI